VAEHLGSAEGDLKSDRLWYEFLIGYIGLKFDLKRMEKLPKSELEAKVEKYSELVFDMAEAQLLKLDQPTVAYLTLSSFRVFL
jgi:hypothetical protein